MKRLNAFFVIAIVACAALLTACGGGGGSSSSNDPAGDGGAILRDKYPQVAKIYNNITSYLGDNAATPAQRTASFTQHVSASASFGTGRALRGTDKNKALEARLDDVLTRYTITTFSFTPNQTNPGYTDTTVVERTKVIIKADPKTPGSGTKKDVEEFKDLTWQKEGGVWKMTGDLSFFWDY